MQDVLDYWALVAASPPERPGGLSGGVGRHWEVTSGHPELLWTLSAFCASAVL